MKKIFMLCSIACCLALSAFAQSGISFNHPNITSGGTVVWTAVGESSTNHIDAGSLGSPHYVITSPTLSAHNPPPYGTGDGNFSSFFTLSFLSVTPYNCTTGAATKITFSCTSTGTVPVNIDVNLHFMMKFDNCNGTNGTTTTDIAPGFTMFPPGVFGNSQRSQNFTRNNCTAPLVGTVVTYTVPANTYAGSTQAAADAQAQNDINANGQNYANAHGSCVTVTVSFAVTNNSNNGLSITFVKSGQSNISVNAPAHSGTQHVNVPAGTGYFIGYNPSGSPVNCNVTLSNGDQHLNAPGGSFTNETVSNTVVYSFTAN